MSETRAGGRAAVVAGVGVALFLPLFMIVFPAAGLAVIDPPRPVVGVHGHLPDAGPLPGPPSTDGHDARSCARGVHQVCTRECSIGGGLPAQAPS